MGLGNRSPWRGEKLANHGELGHGKSGEYPGLGDGREVSTGVRVDLEAPGSMARVRVGSRVSGTRRTWKRSPLGLQPRMDDHQVHLGAKWVRQPMRDGKWWNVVNRNVVLSAMAIHRKPACRYPKGCARRGGQARGTFETALKGGPVTAASEGNLPPVKPQGNLDKVLGREAGP